MSENRVPRVSRSEKLFDSLISKSQTDSPQPKSDTDDAAKINRSKIGTVTDKNESDIELNHMTPSKYKELLSEINSETSISELCARLQNDNFLIKCHSFLNLAVSCNSSLNVEDCKSIFDILHTIPGQHEFHALSFCQALLLYVLTKQKLNVEQFSSLEKCILRVLHSVIQHEGNLGNVFLEPRIVLLGGERYLTAYKLCKKLFPQQNFDVNTLDVSTVCCAALRSLSEARMVSEGKIKFSDSTLKYIITMIGISTQEIISENLIEMEPLENISISSYAVSQCLKVLEQILSADPSTPCKTLDHEDYSLLRCLTKLLECSIMSLFPDQIPDNELFKVENATHAFHLSTLVSILKVFSILSFNPDQYDYYTNGTGTIEKIMICILKIYFQSVEKHFDVLLLALELLINFSLKCKKAYALVCLKKFYVSDSEEIQAIDGLLKILDSNLLKINNMKSGSRTTEEGQGMEEANNSPDLALKVADEDMELSTIASFIGILLMIFMDGKKSFLGFIKERLSAEKCAEVATVSKKFLQVALLTGEMPPTGILLLEESIKKFYQMHQSMLES